MPVTEGQLAREAAGLTVKDLAKRLRVGEAYARKLELHGYAIMEQAESVVRMVNDALVHQGKAPADGNVIMFPRHAKRGDGYTVRRYTVTSYVLVRSTDPGVVARYGIYVSDDDKRTVDADIEACTAHLEQIGAELIATYVGRYDWDRLEMGLRRPIFDGLLVPAIDAFPGRNKGERNQCALDIRRDWHVYVKPLDGRSAKRW